MTTFSENVLSIAEGIPSGKVIPYWKLAERAGAGSPAQSSRGGGGDGPRSGADARLLEGVR